MVEFVTKAFEIVCARQTSSSFQSCCPEVCQVATGGNKLQDLVAQVPQVFLGCAAALLKCVNLGVQVFGYAVPRFGQSGRTSLAYVVGVAGRGRRCATWWPRHRPGPASA